MDTIERVVVLLYDKTNTGSEVNIVRFDQFARKGRDVNNIPPTKGALLQHARRDTRVTILCLEVSKIRRMTLEMADIF